MVSHPLDDDTLAEQVEQAGEDPEAATRSGLFEVTTLDRANRVVFRVGQLRRQLGEATRVYRAEQERLDEWIEDERRRVANQLRFLETLAEHYHRGLLAEDERRLTVHLPAGTLTARKQPDRWDIDDELFVGWAEETKREELLNRTVTLKRGEVKKALEPAVAEGDEWKTAPAVDPATGETVPGVLVVRGDKKFSVDTPEVK